MAKSPVKKSASKKGVRAAAKKSPKKTGKTKEKAVKAPRKPTEKEREVRAANLIANSEKKKKPTVRKRKKQALPDETRTLLDAVIEGMKDRKARNIMVLDLQEIENRVTDYFVICDADSNTHVSSIADSVEETVEKLTGERSYHTEGQGNGEWVLIDYINVVVHVFLRETREHYNIEGLWGDAKITLVND